MVYLGPGEVECSRLGQLQLGREDRLSAGVVGREASLVGRAALGGLIHVDVDGTLYGMRKGRQGVSACVWVSGEPGKWAHR